MFCSNCGAQLPEDALFCPRCGTRADLSLGGDDEKTFADPWAETYKVREPADSGTGAARESGGPAAGSSGSSGSSTPAGSSGTSSGGGRLRFGTGFEKSGFRKDEDYGHTYSRPADDDYRAETGSSRKDDPHRDTYRAETGGRYDDGMGPAPGSRAGRPSREPSGDAEKWIVTGLGIIGLTGLVRVLLWALQQVLYFVIFRTYANGLIFFSNVLYRFQQVVNILILALCAAALGGAVWLVTQREGEDRQMPAVGAAAAILLGASCICRILYLPFWITALLLVAAVLIGLDLCINVFAEKNSLYGAFRLDDDLEALRKFLQKEETVDPKMYTDRKIPHYETTPEHESKDSYFDGTGLQLLGHALVVVLLSVFTCGIGAPWGFVRLRRWVMSHTVIEGRRQTFNGTGGQMFGLYIKWALLTIITCGIYLIFASVDYMKWEVKHTSYEDGSAPLDGAYPYSVFDGGVGEFFGNALISGLLTVFTCGIGAPWGITIIQKWATKSTVIEGERYFFDGTGGQLFGIYLINALFTIITCGIYAPWAVCRMNRYIINHTHVDATYSYHRDR